MHSRFSFALPLHFSGVVWFSIQAGNVVSISAEAKLDTPGARLSHRLDDTLCIDELGGLVGMEQER